jgi:hypothetical protein
VAAGWLGGTFFCNILFFFFLEVKWRPRKLSCVSRKCGGGAPHVRLHDEGRSPTRKGKTKKNNLVSTSRSPYYVSLFDIDIF